MRCCAGDQKRNPDCGGNASSQIAAEETAMLQTSKLRTRFAMPERGFRFITNTSSKCAAYWSPPKPVIGRSKHGLPRCRLVVLQKLPPDVLACQPPREYRIDNARGAVNDVQRRREAQVRLAGRMSCRIFVSYPPGVHGIHVDSVLDEVRCAGARHHVERRLRHVGVRVLVSLGGAIELPLYRTDVDDMLVTLGRPQQQWFETSVQHIGSDGVHQLHLEKLRRLDLMQAQSPAVDLTQIHLLQILVVSIGREQRLAVAIVFIEIAPLREHCAMQQSLTAQPLTLPITLPHRRRDQRAVSLRPRSFDAPP